MNYPIVHITKLTKDGVPNSTLKINLGGTHSQEARRTEHLVTTVLKEIRNRSEHCFLLKWEGNKIPRGSEILGKKISWTQNGLVYDEGGAIIGNYERLVEFGGASKKEQEMLIFC